MPVDTPPTDPHRLQGAPSPEELEAAQAADQAEAQDAASAAQAELAFDLTPENGRLAMAVATCYHYAGQTEEAEAWQQLGRHLLDGAAKLDGHGDDSKDDDSED